MVTRRALPLLRQLSKQPCPKREGNATHLLASSLCDSYESVGELHTHMVSPCSDRGKVTETAGGKEDLARAGDVIVVM